MSHVRVRLLLAALLLASAATLAAAQLWVGPWPTCDASSGNYTAGSAYTNTTQQLILALQTNASASPTLFATGSRSTSGAAAVYGLLLCRGDLSSSDCFDCGTRAGQDVERVCNGTLSTPRSCTTIATSASPPPTSSPRPTTPASSTSSTLWYGMYLLCGHVNKTAQVQAY
ncbi:unnamed protein product [Urochloa humidicola]